MVLITMHEIKNGERNVFSDHLFYLTQVAFEASMREATRLLEEHSVKLQRGQCIKDGTFDDGLHQSITARVGVLLQRMSSELTQECERMGAWGVLGQGTGGVLVRPNTGEPVAKSDLIGKCFFATLKRID